MLGFVGQDLVTAPERTSGSLMATCRGCGHPVHIGESIVLVEHVHGPECLRRARERERRFVDALDQVFALGISMLGCLAALGVALMLLRAVGVVGPEVGR